MPSHPEQDQKEDECECLESVLRHEYEEPDDSTFQTDKGKGEEEENHYEPIGGMQELK